MINIPVGRGRIVIESYETVAYDLDQLFSGITTKNAHGEAGFGGPVGKEAC